jgi:hypothetical protein
MLVSSREFPNSKYLFLLYSKFISKVKMNASAIHTPARLVYKKISSVDLGMNKSAESGLNREYLMITSLFPHL